MRPTTDLQHNVILQSRTENLRKLIENSPRRIIFYIMNDERQLENKNK